VTFQANIPLSPFTTIGLGGKARFFVTCSSEADLREALMHAREKRLRVHVLGGGSNTIFAGEEFDGLILQVASRGVRYEERSSNVLVSAAAGEPWDPLVQSCIRRGLGGLECLSGIPGLVGATPIQNVGAYGQEVAETILSVEALDRTSLRTVTFPGAECRFGYRTSRFKQEDAEQYIITAVTFRLTPGARPTLRYPELQRSVHQSVDLSALGGGGGKEALGAVRDAVLRLRRGKSMVIDPADPESRSVGSFFTNPVVPRRSSNPSRIGGRRREERTLSRISRPVPS
jgi:UDP-N-acetylmuramate dehydrogenase